MKDKQIHTSVQSILTRSLKELAEDRSMVNDKLYPHVEKLRDHKDSPMPAWKGKCKS